MVIHEQDKPDLAPEVVFMTTRLGKIIDSPPASITEV
jgi:hypothetical protein